MKPLLTAHGFVRRLWREWIRPLALPVLLVTAAKSALAEINYVPTGSMKPTIVEGDVVFVNKLAYDLRVPFTLTRVAHWAGPARGDVVVCFSPADGMRLVKRVVGLPGDTVEMRNEVVLINGIAQTYGPAEPAARNASRAASADATIGRETLIGSGRSHAMMIEPSRPALRSFGPVAIPADGYFMLGDNRDNSLDSRFFGPVARRQIVGEAKGIFVSADLNRWLRPRFERFFTSLE